MNRLFYPTPTLPGGPTPTLPGGLAVWVVAVIALGAGALSVSCSRDDSNSQAGSIPAVPSPDTVDVLDEELMICLSQAKNFHHKADVYLRDGSLEQAADSVRQIIGAPCPADAPEVEDVRLDARARLAKIMLTQGNVDEAMKVVQQGIEKSTRDSFFLANLYTVKGEVHEATAILLVDSESDEDKATARAESKLAIEAYDRSIKINAGLQQKLMRERQQCGRASSWSPPSPGWGWARWSPDRAPPRPRCSIPSTSPTAEMRSPDSRCRSATGGAKPAWMSSPGPTS